MHIKHFFCLLILKLFLVGCNDSKDVQNSIEAYKFGHVLKKDTVYFKEFVATIQAQNKVEIRTKLLGYIQSVLIDEGDYVKEGQLLFTLNAKEFDNDLRRTKAKLKSAEAEREKLLIELRNSKRLFEKNIVSSSEIEVANSNLAACESRCEELRAEVATASLFVSYTQIKAPINGYINRIPFKTGSLVEEGTVLTTLTNNDEVFAYFKVSESEYLDFLKNKLLVKNSAIRLRLADETFHAQKGHIETLDSEFDNSTGTLSIRGRFPNSNHVLKQGSSGKVVVPFELKNALLVPISATFEEQDLIYIYVLGKESKLYRKRIQPLVTLGEYFVLQNGISTKEKILLEGIQLVSDGQLVKEKQKSK